MFSFLIVCGTTGESVSLTVSERKLVVEEWMRVAKGRYHFNEWMDGWIGRWMDGWMDEWMDR